MVAFCYSSVGHGGASGYLGVLSFFVFNPRELSTTALLLNILVSATATFSYKKAGHFRLHLLYPFLLTSIPFSFLGGTLKISLKLYSLILAFALIVAAIRLNWKLRSSSEEPKNPPLWAALWLGAGIGIVSGMIGIGGGIFLSPVLILANGSTIKEAAAVSAPFILINSCAGILGRFFSETLVLGNLTPLMISAFLGGLLGSYLGANRFSSSILRVVLGIVLILASFKLLL